MFLHIMRSLAHGEALTHVIFRWQRIFVCSVFS